MDLFSEYIEYPYDYSDSNPDIMQFSNELTDTYSESRTVSPSELYTPSQLQLQTEHQSQQDGQGSTSMLSEGSNNNSNGSLTVPQSHEHQPKKKGRKGHSKSRAGCYNCKKARIKCKENRPVCDYCDHRDLNCVWPDVQINNTSAELMRRSSDNSSNSNVSRQLAAQYPSPELVRGFMPPVFNMQDFRLFNTFIQTAYPHHPIGNDSVWKHEIPNIAHNYDYLLHSMLGLAASELASTTDITPQMHATALTHRVKAITSLNNAISLGITCPEEGNAMIATCFTLLFQSCLLEDGLVEFMTFIRGTLSVGMQMGMRGMDFLFQKIFADEQLAQVDPLMKQAGLLPSQVVQAACRSFERMAHLCTSKIELEVYEVLFGIARALVTSSRDAYMSLRKMYELFSWTMTQPDFEYYCSPSNEACKILQAHFVALQLIMSPITRNECASKEKASPSDEDPFGGGKTVGWLIGIHNHARKDMLKYYQFTLWVQNEVLAGTLYNTIIRDEAIPELLELMG